jgi:hypothetical protein
MTLAMLFVPGCGGRTIRLGVQPSVDSGQPCSKGQIKPSEVIWIGDSWILLPPAAPVHTYLRDLARQAESLGSTEDYTVLAAPAKSMSDIANQYRTQEDSPTKVKVVLMDGGTWDTIQQKGSAASVSAAAGSFDLFLSQAASDGTVKSIVYFLPPELASIPGVKDLRPLFQASCAKSSVPCYFLDLKDFADHPDYTDSSSGIGVPTALGSQVVAQRMWSIMQTECIAQ